MSFEKAETEMLKKIVEDTKAAVREHFKALYSAVSFGAYIEPENYFVSYIFNTDKELKDAEESGLLEEIKTFHKTKMKELGYPEEPIKECVFASMEDCQRYSKGNWYYYYH